MKFLLLILMFSPVYKYESHLYDINFQNINGTNTEMLSLSDKRLLVIVVDAANPNINQIWLADSVAHTDSVTAKLIVVPALDLSETPGQFSMDTLYARLTGMIESGIIISTPSMVKKSAGETQHPLLKWLTNVNQNGHFDKDIVQDCQMFMVNENGVLYGVHSYILDALTMRNVMLQTVPE